MNIDFLILILNMMFSAKLKLSKIKAKLIYKAALWNLKSKDNWEVIRRATFQGTMYEEYMQEEIVNHLFPV